tara:strand:- start:3518 stop:3670 length:153 start_codon:yes stop_codon:yes gene_type:complete
MVSKLVPAFFVIRPLMPSWLAKHQLEQRTCQGSLTMGTLAMVQRVIILGK